jgi:predicted phosphodiesterase
MLEPVISAMSVPSLAIQSPVGVIADTHGLLRDEALILLSGCELILHLGDVGSREADEAILEWLAGMAPLYTARGNIDTPAWAERLLLTHDLVVNGWRLHLVHRLADADEMIACDAVLHGPSHKPRNAWQEGRLLFNPGAAGKRRFRLPITLGRLWADERGLRGVILHLPLLSVSDDRADADPPDPASRPFDQQSSSTSSSAASACRFCPSSVFKGSGRLGGSTSPSSSAAVAPPGVAPPPRRTRCRAPRPPRL